jgi:Gpi18-like mannosyltransferase
MGIWFNTGAWMNQGINIYMPNDHIGYPPLWGFWCLVAYRAYAFFGNNLEIWRLVIKMPLILGHLLLSFVIGKFAETRFDRKTARRVFFITLTWSFFIFIGAMWGQINVLSALLTLLAFWAVTSRKTTTAAVLLGTAVTLKLYPLITVPFFSLTFLKN